MTLVAGVDSSTQSCKVVVCDAETGAVVRAGVARHPNGTEVDPQAWWQALERAAEAAGGLNDVDAISVGAQQHGLVCLDESGEVIRPALLWNDTRSAGAAEQLVADLDDGTTSGARAWADAVGSVPVAALTVTKLRWLADHEPENARRVAAVALPHDWLTWRLSGARGLQSLTTDRSDASGTGYYDCSTGDWRRDLLALALRRAVDEVQGLVLPRVVDPGGQAAQTSGPVSSGAMLGAGCGDNAGAALGLQLQAGGTLISIGTSGVVAAVSTTSTHDDTGLVAGFADGLGGFLPLSCTLNGSRVLDAMATVLGVDHDRLSELALSAPRGADGLVQVPYLEGERTPNLPDASGTLYNLTLSSMTPANLARAAVEGLLCLLADAMDAVRAQGVLIERVTVVGGGARSVAVRTLAPSLLGVPVTVPTSAEYVALGAARQAAWSLSGAAEPPVWAARQDSVYEADHTPEIVERYRSFAALSDTHPSQEAGAR